MTGTLFSRYMGEFIGTCMLVLMGCGGAIFAGPHIGVVGVALSFGLTLLLLAYCLGNISGCHLNPAVTICLAAVKKFPCSQVAGYILAQCFGAILGGLILYSIATGKVGFDITKGFALNGFGEHSPEGYSMIACFLTEVIMTALLLFVVLSTTRTLFPSGFAGLAIGFTLVVIHLVSIPITNTSVNIARSLGVAVVYGGWAIEQLWMFASAHLMAIILAITLYRVTSTQE